jgi:hypothetical protein
MLVTVAGIPYSTQLYFVEPTEGTVLINTAYSTVPVGAPDQARGGDFASPSQVKVVGNAPLTTPELEMANVVVGGGVGVVVVGSADDDSPPHAERSVTSHAVVSIWTFIIGRAEYRTDRQSRRCRP